MTLPSWALAELLKRDGEEPGIWLATLSGAELGGVIRLARNTEDFASRGQTYRAAIFEVSLPTDTESQPAASFEIPNVDREVGLALVEMTETVSITFELVFPSHPDEPVERFAMLELVLAQIDPITVSGQLAAADLDNEPYISLRVTPAEFPGLWRAR